MTRAQAAKKFPLTPEELRLLDYAAEGVWQAIGCDVLQALGEGKRNPDSVTVSRSTVIELVMDANRLEDELRRDMTPGLSALFPDIQSGNWGHSIAALSAYLKADVFKFSRYGF